ncbi:MAG: Gfo/Idh/MocA family oxidoreductase [Armatimonadetes bacterium]|nr:Gfo/Idh/MocA family oxidoreductase [Armatimonadota bacterium]
MSSTYRAVIIGCGSIGSAHAHGYLGARQIELVAAADVHPGARADFQQRFPGLRLYADYGEMIARERPDLVSICLWHPLHAEVTVAVANLGVPGILCEKPMAVDLQEADAMIAAAAASGSRLAIAHQRRFLATWTEVKRLIAAGAIGQPLMLWGGICDGILNWGTHVIDGMRYVLGDPAPEWVIAQVERRTDRYERGIRIEDRCAGLVRFAGGVRAVLEMELEKDGPANAGGFTVFGSEGSLRMDERQLVIGGAHTSPDEIREPEYVDPHVAQAEEMVAWLEGQVEHRGRAELARPTQEVLIAFYESVRQRGLVRLPVTPGPFPLDDLVESGRLPVEQEGRYDIRQFLLRPGAEAPAYRPRR